MAPGKSEQDTSLWGVRIYLHSPEQEWGERNRGDKVKGHNQVQNLENLVAPIPQVCLEREGRRGQLSVKSVSIPHPS